MSEPIALLTSDAPTLSVVIRCRNEANSLTEVLEALSAQACRFSFEIVVVDNESEDETPGVAARFGAKVVHMRRENFSYGRALNLGISHARGPLVLLLSAHAIPLGRTFLERAIAPLCDPEVSAVRCLNVGNTDQIRRWFLPRSIQYGGPEEQRLAESSDSWPREYPTASCCVIRRSVWDQIRYDEALEANEDKEWASRVLRAGHKVYFGADAFWFYSRQLSRHERRRKQLREYTALYRATRRAPLTWSHFWWLALRACFVAPAKAFAHFVEDVSWNATLVTVPWRARTKASAGSHPDFDRRN